MKVTVALPSGDSVSYRVDELGLENVGQLHDYLSEEQGIPKEQQLFRTAHTMLPITDHSSLLSDIHKQGNFRGNELRLDLLIDLSGSGGSSSCNVGNFEPAVKILCFQCSCTGEWQSNQLCCCKCRCSIQ